MKLRIVCQALVALAVAATASVAQAQAINVRTALQGGIPSGSQSPAAGRMLDLADLQQLAMEYNPTLPQARLHVDAERARAKQAGLWLNPTVGVVSEPLPYAPIEGDFTGFTLEQTIVTGGKLGLSRQKYRARADTAEHLLEMQRMRVRTDVRVKYYELLAKAMELEAHEALLRNAEDHRATVMEMVNLGQANPGDLSESNASLELVKLDHQMALNHYRATSQELGATIGVDLSDAEIIGELEGELRVIDFDEALNRIINESPELAATRSEVETDKIEVRREKRELFPEISVAVGIGRSHAEGPWSHAPTAYRLHASAEIPVFDRNHGTVDQAKQELQRQQNEVRRLELQLRRDLAHHYKEYLSQLQHVRDYKAVVLPELRSAYEERLQGYEAGREDWMQVLETQREYYHERLDYAEHLEHWREAEAIIEGLLLHGGLEIPEGATPAGHIDATAKPR